MRIYDTPQTKNPCYRRAQPMRPVGILVHSTGASNQHLKRYVDAPELVGRNIYGNHWNREDGTACMHAFIGLDINGEVAICHTLPYTVASWGCGAGWNGSYNRDPVGHIQFEICEDHAPRSGKPPTPQQRAYYQAAIQATEEYCAYLCRLYSLPVSSICGHVEAAARGYAFPRADPEHWMRLYNDDMDKFRARVAMRLAGGAPVDIETKEEGDMVHLYRGSRGDQVKQLQLALIGLQHDVGRTGADGIFGAATEKAVQQFQEVHGIPQSGVWTDREQGLLDEINSRPPVVGQPVDDQEADYMAALVKQAEEQLAGLDITVKAMWRYVTEGK